MAFTSKRSPLRSRRLASALRLSPSLAIALVGTLAAFGSATAVGCSAPSGDVATESSARIETNVECPFLRPTKTGTRATYSVKSNVRTGSHSRIETNKGLTDPENGQFASTSFDWQVEEAAVADAGAVESIETIHVDSSRCSTARILDSGATTETLLDGPPVANHKFETNHDGVNFVREWGAAESTVTVPAGTFEHCWTLTTHRPGETDVTSVEVHCRGLGLVRADFTRSLRAASLADAGATKDAAGNADASKADAAAADAGSIPTATPVQEHWELARHSWSIAEDDAGTEDAGKVDAASADASDAARTADSGTVVVRPDGGEEEEDEDDDDDAGTRSDASATGDGGKREAGSSTGTGGSSGRVTLPDDDFDDDTTGATRGSGSSQPQTPRVIGEDEDTKVSSSFKSAESRRSCSAAPIGTDGSSPLAVVFGGVGILAAFARRKRSSNS